MLKDVVFNGNKVSGGKYDCEEEQDISRDGYSGDFSSTRKSGEFDPSESAGEAFRSVFDCRIRVGQDSGLYSASRA